MRLICALALALLGSCRQADRSNRDVQPKMIGGPAGALHVDDGGTGGVPVVFLHSAAGNTRHWSAQLAHLRQSRRAVAFDRRGHGRSDPPRDGDYSIPSLAADVAAVVDTLGLERFVLIGHSIGAVVALAYADAHAERVAGLLLLDPAGDARRIPAPQAKMLVGALESPAYASVVEDYWRQILEGSSAAMRDSLLADLRATPKDAVVAAFTAMLVFDPVSALRRYRGPVLSVTTRFNEVPIALHRLVPDLPHRLVDGTGHWLQMDKPDEVNSIIDEFLKAVGR